MTWEHDHIEVLRQLKELNERQQDWVWEVAKQLHDAKWETAACFKAALNAVDWTAAPYCEACGAFTIYPADHYRHEDQGYTCPLAELDDPAYVAYCILTEPEGETDTWESEATSPAGWSHP